MELLSRVYDLSVDREVGESLGWLGPFCLVAFCCNGTILIVDVMKVVLFLGFGTRTVQQGRVCNKVSALLLPTLLCSICSFSRLKLRVQNS